MYIGPLCLSLTGYTLAGEKSSCKLMNAERGKVEGIHWTACLCVYLHSSLALILVLQLIALKPT